MMNTPEILTIPKAHILVVDDDEIVCKLVSRAHSQKGHLCTTAASGEDGLRAIHEQRFDLIITDMVMPGFDGVTFVNTIKSIDASIPVIMMTGYSSIDLAVKAMKAGAFHFLAKPVRMAELLVYVEKALASHEMLVEVKELKDQLKSYQHASAIIGSSQAMREIITKVEQIAPSTANVLITGETGTGKEMIADVIHARSPRAAKALIKVNCGALPETLLESELFGHEKGAFTGAYKEHQGRFEMADGGSIFLDEIGEMSPSAQVRLLRVLQEGQFERVGSSKTIHVDVRVIAATNRDLQDLVKQGKFREDLFYRINVFHLHLPPLRNRKGDLALLASHFIHKYAEKNHKAVQGLGQNAYRLLERHPWPGNVRELENVIEHAVIMARGDRILEENLPDLFHAKEKEKQKKILIPLGYSMRDAEGIILRRTLEMTQGDKEATAHILGYSRRTLYRKIHEQNLPSNYGTSKTGGSPRHADPTE
ncbi:MAG: sigma-54 dependent transcriptional regulator [bacterium]|jgi:two-component system NtrC family response regulator|nr:sigma-54 dependent transcriptional regulator [bacterium]